MTQLLDGKALAAEIRSTLTTDIAAFTQKTGIHPQLVVIIVGDDPASHVYVNNKEKSALEIGMRSQVHRLPADIPQDDLNRIIDDLNADKDVHGILVQMPLPKHLNEYQVIDRIHPNKDVDGFHTYNTGMLHGAGAGKGNHLLPCTPYGCILLLEKAGIDIAGKNAVVIGRSHIVGRPVAELLLQRDATVTIAHSRTKNLPELCAGADIIVAAVGRSHFVKVDWVKQGAVIVDVGINRIILDDGKSKLTGDVDFDAVREKASYITPVPGGVGPMTITCLLQNTLQAAKIQTHS